MSARALLLALSLSLAACGPKKPVGAPAASETVVEPVLFGTNNDVVSTPDNLMRVGAVAERLKADDKLVVVLVGYTDTSGAAEANLALSKGRAEAVRELVLQAAGVDGARVMVVGRGEVNTTGDARTDRRVEFVFGRAKGGAVPEPEAVLAASAPVAAAPADPAAAGAGGPADKASSGDAPARSGGGDDDIVPTGLSDVDAVFSQVQGLLDLVRGAQGDIAEAERALHAALGAKEGASLDEALAGLKEQAKGAVSVKMVGGKPQVAVKPGASPEVGKAVSALNNLVTALGKATARLAQVPKQATAIVQQAKTIPARLPNMLKESGMGMAAMPKTLKAVKHNLKLTASVPKECGEIGKAAANTFKSVGAAFK